MKKQKNTTSAQKQRITMEDYLRHGFKSRGHGGGIYELPGTPLSIMHTATAIKVLLKYADTGKTINSAAELDELVKHYR